MRCMLLLAVVVTILGGFSAISGFQAKPSLSLGAASTSDNAAAVSTPGSGIVLTVPPQTTGPAYWFIALAQYDNPENGGNGEELPLEFCDARLLRQSFKVWVWRNPT